MKGEPRRLKGPLTRAVAEFLNAANGLRPLTRHPYASVAVFWFGWPTSEVPEIYLTASVLDALHMLSLTLATWWEPGQGISVWHYFGAELDHLPLLFLFIIFFVADAGQEWGLDGRRQHTPKR